MAAKAKAGSAKLKAIIDLYKEGEILSAFDALDDLIEEHPDNAEWALLKAQWSVERRRNAEFVGATVAGYQQNAQISADEQSLIEQTLTWSEECLEDARRDLGMRDYDDALSAIITARQLAPSVARNFLAIGLMLVEALPSKRDDAADEGIMRSGSLRGLPSRPPSDLAMMVREAESALERARELAPQNDVVWQQATRQLAMLLDWRGLARQALLTLRTLGDAADASIREQIKSLEVRTMTKAVKDAIQRAQQLLRQDDQSAASELIELVITSAPYALGGWLTMADWFVIQHNDTAAASLYLWIMRDGESLLDGAAHGVQQASSAEQIEAALEKFVIKCKRCGKELSSSTLKCGVCAQPLRSDVLLSDRHDVTKLKVGQIAALGMIELHLRHEEFIEASSQISLLIGQLEKRNPVLPRLDAWLREIRPKAEAKAFDAALGNAVSLARAGQIADAHAVLQAISGKADDRREAWLALTLGGEGGLSHSANGIVRRAGRVGIDIWATTPSPLRQRLVNLLLAEGWLPEARALLGGMFTETERKTKTVQKLIDRCAKLIETRITELLTEARFSIEEGHIDDAYAPVSQALGIDPKHSGALLMRGQLHLINDAPYSAATDFRTVMQLGGAPAIAGALGLARTYEALRDLPEALATLETLPAHLPEVSALKSHFERQRQGQPAVRIKELAASDGSMYSGIFAVAIRAVMRWREGDRLTISRREIVHAGHEFIATLGGLAESAGNPTFEIRMIATPDVEAPARGTIRLALMCRVTSMIPEGAERLALELWDRLRSHLPVAEHYLYQYEPVYDEAELAWLLQPFEVRDAAEIVRREAWEDENAYAVQPFTTGGTTLENLAWILLRQSEPGMVTIHVEPTQLQVNERTEFRKNLERLRRIRLPDDEDSAAETPFDPMRRTVFLPDGQRGSLAEMAGDLGHSLEKRAYLMHITVASVEAHASMLSHHIASEIFGPGGRYDVVHAVKEKAKAAVKYNLGELDAMAWVQNSAPKRLARLRYLVSEIEAGWTFRLPMPGIEGIPGMAQIAVKAAPPTLLPAEGIMLGESVATISGVPAIIRARQADRRRHAYVIGKTGVGKSTLLEAMALQDIEAGRGVAFLDPHGDSIESILGRIPAHRMDDVIVFDPSDETRPIGLNFLEAETDSQRHRIATEFIQMLMRMYDPHQMGIVGPRFQHNVRNAMLTAMMAVEGATLIELVRVLTDGAFVREILPNVHDPVVRNYWEKQIANTSDFHKSEVLDYIVSKFNRFVGDVRIRNIIGQSKSSLDFRQIMDDRKILLVNLSKGKIGPESAEFLGFLLLQSLLIAALSRADQVREERDDYCLYVDEFQTFATESFAAMLSEGRKYGICLVMANQYLGQLPGDLRQAVFGNVGSLIAFGVGSDDAQHLASQFYPVFGGDDLMNLPKFTAAVRLLVDGMQARPFAMRTRLVKRIPDGDHAATIREMSRMRYGRDIAAVNVEINARFKIAA